MSQRSSLFGLLLALAAVGSCAPHNTAPPTATPTATAPRTGTGVAAAPSAPAPAAPASAPSAGAPPGGSPTPEQRAARRDSLTAVRAQSVKVLMEKLAGKEKMRAGDVFANLTLLQDSSVEAVVKIMDESYGRGLGVSCTFCHVDGQWDDDKKEDKETSRKMIKMMAALNSEYLTKIPLERGKSPTVDCITCHRGMNHPGRAVLP